MAETLANGTVVPQGSDPIHASGVQWGRNMGGSIDAQLGDRYTKAVVDSLLAGKSPTTHTHDDRYYTEGEVDQRITAALETLAAFTQDTGWRDVSLDLTGGATGVLHIRRVGMLVHWRVKNLVPGVGHNFYTPPPGMRTSADANVYPADVALVGVPFYRHADGRFARSIYEAPVAAGLWWEDDYVLPPSTPPITNLPGKGV